MKEDKDISPETTEPDFNQKEHSKDQKANGTASSPVDGEIIPNDDPLNPTSDPTDINSSDEPSEKLDSTSQEKTDSAEADTPSELSAFSVEKANDAAGLVQQDELSDSPEEKSHPSGSQTQKGDINSETEASNAVDQVSEDTRSSIITEEVKESEASTIVGKAMDTPSEEDQQSTDTVEAPKDQQETEIGSDTLVESETPTSEGGTLKDPQNTSAKSEEAPSNEKLEKEVGDPLAKWEHEDYKSYTKEELLKVIDQMLKGNDVLLADRVLNIVAPLFDNHRKAEKDKALELFVADGNDAKDFDYKYDETDHRFDADFRLIKDRKREYYKNLEKEKDENLIIKNELLEELRELVHAEETNISMEAMKSLQKRWKEVGPVPRAQVRTLWANYNALLDLFYDQRSIYFELKELDRRKNLEAKEELCEKAEQLEHEKSLKEAINQLNDLHHEYKHIGPVPKLQQEALWQRFKAASDKIYARRKEFVKHLKVEQKGNLEAKKTLVEELKDFASFDSERITDWNQQTNNLLALQKRWEGIGSIPKEYAKSVNKEFWKLFKQFFQHKNQFFKKLEKQRDENLIKKQALVEKAEGLKDSTEWDKTAQVLKDIQQEWRNIGPVPEKQKKAIYDTFKAACDAFFDHRREHQKDLDVEYIANLKQKEAICEKLEQMAQKHSNDIDTFKKLQEDFDQIGYVPSNAIRKIRKKYETAVAHFLKETTGLDEHDKQQLKFSQEFNRLKSGPNADRKLGQKEQAIRREIGKIENDISLWKNNLEFFAASKTADKLREEFNQKIDDATDQLYDLKSQLRMIRSV